MAKRTTTVGRKRRMSTLVNAGLITQKAVRAELENQRKVFGTAGVAHAMKKWELRQGRGKKSAQSTGIVRSRGRITGRKG